ncbi:hypothetical protein BHM03_00055954 [Ensete ventricosum]|nr:hypothetical protein BHM03_00055954 [Ensete ventricosum]
MSRLPEVPGGTHLHLKQHVPHARMHRFGLECRLHLTPHSPAQSAKSFSCTMGLQHRETWLPKKRYVYVLLKEETVLVKEEKKHGEEKLPPAQSHGELVEQRSDEPK